MKEMTRKQSRKANRKLKKAKRLAFISKKPIEDAVKQVPGASRALASTKSKTKKKRKKKPKQQMADTATEPKEEMRLDSEAVKKARRKVQRDLVREEEMEAKKMAKKLGLNKRRKTQSLPKAFFNDGLDYLLDVCEGGALEKGMAEDDVSPVEEVSDQDDSNSDMESEDGTPSTSMAEEIGAKNLKRRVVQFADDGQDKMDGQDSGNESDQSEEDESVGKSKGKKWMEVDGRRVREDIYGRLVDEEGGVVGGLSRSGAEQKLAELDGRGMPEGEEKERLHKHIKGLINRVSEGSLHGSIKTLENLYHTQSRNEVKNVLSTCLLNAFTVPHNIPPRMAMEYSALIALIHSNLSSEISAYFVEALALRFSEWRSRDLDIDDKSLDNLIALFGHLYNFKIVNAKLIFEVMESLLEMFSDKDVEYLLWYLTNVGFSLRKDDPEGLRNLIQAIQVKIGSGPSLESSQSKVKFMFETLMGVKNNNILKVGNKAYDPEVLEHLIKVVRGLATKGSTFGERLPFGFNDLLNAGSKGRWWIVGSAWIGNPDRSLLHSAADTTGKDTNSALGQNSALLSTEKGKPKYDQKLLDLAEKYRMNTELRRTIFCITMGAEDFIDAFEKLMKLSLKDKQEREIIHIIVNCCLREKQFNPYYSLLLHKFCTFHGRFQVTTQYAVWDRVKEMENLKSNQKRNLAFLLAKLIQLGALGLSVLKVVDFADLERSKSDFVQTVLSKLLVDCTEGVLETIFQRIVKNSKDNPGVKVLVDGLTLFIEHIMRKRIKTSDFRNWTQNPDETMGIVVQKIDFVHKLLVSIQGSHSL